MEIEAGAAIGSAFIGAIAAGIALWQARIARNQANLAKASARAARRQAAAAEEQVEIMRRQLAGEEADRVEARRPQFIVTSATVTWEDVNFPRARIAIKQVNGVALKSVTVTTSGSYVTGLQGDRLSDEYIHVSRLTLGRMARGTEETFGVDLEYEHITPFRLALELRCTALEGDHEWIEHLITNVTRPDDESPSRGPRRRRPLSD